ncbi:MAG: O-antigen ligase family protein [bacterium]
MKRIYITRNKINIMIPFFLGFLIIMNIYLFSFSGVLFRITDVLGILMYIILFFNILTNKVQKQIFYIIIISCPFIIWIFVSFILNDSETISMSIRWILALPWGYYIYKFCKSEYTKTFLVYGMIVGILVNLLILLIQYLGFLNITELLGLSLPNDKYMTVNNNIRVPGMHGHPNASSAVISLVIPMVLYLVYKYNLNSIYIIFSLGVLYLGGQFTSTRTPIVVSIMLLVSFFISRFRYYRTHKIILVLMMISIIFISLVGPPGGWDRWLDSKNYNVNSQGRMDTILHSIQMIIDYPLGVGLKNYRNLSGFAASHNAFLQLSIIYGLPISLFIIIILLIFPFFLFLKYSNLLLESIFSVQIIGLFMFEDHFHNPTFIILTCWFIITGCNLIFKKLKLKKNPYKENEKRGA